MKDFVSLLQNPEKKKEELKARWKKRIEKLKQNQDINQTGQQELLNIYTEGKTNGNEFD